MYENVTLCGLGQYYGKRTRQVVYKQKEKDSLVKESFPVSSQRLNPQYQRKALRYVTKNNYDYDQPIKKNTLSEHGIKKMTNLS